MLDENTSEARRKPLIHLSAFPAPSSPQVGERPRVRLQPRAARPDMVPEGELPPVGRFENPEIRVVEGVGQVDRPHPLAARKRGEARLRALAGAGSGW